VPAYLEIQLKDPEYIGVWVNQDQRRLSQLLAEGYELLKTEHMAPNFQVPLKFDSEGLYRYQDVIAMRVHKRIKFGKQRKIVQMSVQQLNNAQLQAKGKLKEKVIEKDPAMEEAFNRGALSYF
jgi:hypothetical protein